MPRCAPARLCHCRAARPTGPFGRALVSAAVGARPPSRHRDAKRFDDLSAGAREAFAFDFRGPRRRQAADGSADGGASAEGRSRTVRHSGGCAGGRRGHGSGHAQQRSRGRPASTGAVVNAARRRARWTASRRPFGRGGRSGASRERRRRPQRFDSGAGSRCARFDGIESACRRCARACRGQAQSGAPASSAAAAAIQRQRGHGAGQRTTRQRASAAAGEWQSWKRQRSARYEPAATAAADEWQFERRVSR